jgi:MFS family permease
MSIKISRIIYILTIADIMIVSAFSLIMPLFAIFITENIIGAGVKTVGFFTGIYWISKSFFQIPIAWFLDKKEGEKDEFYAMIAGYFLTTLIAFSYIKANVVWHIYGLAVLTGLADALGVPSYLSVFSRHLDKFKENIEWTVRSIGVGLAAAGAGALAGILVDKFGFNSVFISGGILSFFAAITLFFIKPYLKTKDGRSIVPPSIGSRKI